MNQKETAREMLAKIEKVFFKGAGLAKASLLEGDERRAFVLSQVERLLTKERASSPLAMLLSDRFWTADEGRMPMSGENPLLSLKELQTLTDKEMGRLRLILEIAGLCHDLSLHFMFDLKEAFGIKNDFWVSNKQLVEWLTTTPHERIAMHTAYIMRKFAINKYEAEHYLPAQDAIAEIFLKGYGVLDRPNNTKIPPRIYANAIIEELRRVERHWQRGRRLKLNPEVVILHDEIYGVVPRQFDKGVLAAAQALFDYMEKEVRGRGATDEVMDCFAEKVCEVRAQYLAEGWIADYSLAFNYLMAHAQLYSSWRKEDEAL